MSGKLGLLVVAVCLFVTNRATSQDLLERPVTLDLRDVPLQNALAEIARQAECRFSFNPDLLPKTKVNASFEAVTLEDALKTTLGRRFSYKVRGSYVIIQPTVEKVSPKSSMAFEGEVVDARTGQRLSNTSVYEVNNLSSTLSDQDGSYKLSTFFQDGVTAFAISKENYRDTIIRVTDPQIQMVRVELQPLEKVEGPRDRNIFRWIDSLNLVRFLVNSKAKLHMRNVEMVEQRWVQVSLLPVLGTNGLMGGKIGNNVSLNIMAGYSHSVQGVELGGFFNVDRMDVKGLQAAGFGNIVGGRMVGAQLAGYVNLTPGGGGGTQLSGFVNHAGTAFKGMQGTGFVNISNATKGAQLAGFTNFTLLEMKGVQASGFLNMTGTLSGAQFSGFLNMAGAVKGAQLSGFLNMAGTVRGVQVGIVNVAKKVEKGATIGIINLVKEGGIHALDIGANDVTPINLSFRSGTPHFYTILAVGVLPASEGLFSAGIGLGTQVSWTDKLYTDFELSSHLVLPSESLVEVISDDRRFQINMGFRFKKWASVNAGPVVHFYKFDSNTSINLAERFGSRPIFQSEGSSGSTKVWVGYSASVRLF